MEHYFFVCNVAVVVLVGIKGDKDSLVIFGILHKAVFLLRLIGLIENDVVLALESILVALHIADEYELGIFGSIDIVPFLHQESLRFFVHGVDILINLKIIKMMGIVNKGGLSID